MHYEVCVTYQQHDHSGAIAVPAPMPLGIARQRRGLSGSFGVVPFLEGLAAEIARYVIGYQLDSNNKGSPCMLSFWRGNTCLTTLLTVRRRARVHREDVRDGEKKMGG
jgi:hypothetical protein